MHNLQKKLKKDKKELKNLTKGLCLRWCKVFFNCMLSFHYYKKVNTEKGFQKKESNFKI